MEKRTDLSPDYLKRQLSLLRRDLSLARKYQQPIIPTKGKDREFTVYYGEYDIFDNLEVVGEDYIWQMYRDSPPLIWETGSSSESYADLITRIFEENNYEVEPVFVGQPPRHDWKHEGIDLSLKGAPQYLQIRFNLMNNEFLKIAMEQTGIRQGRNGFEKDKKPESTPDSEDAPDEYKTHITDAFDTLWYGMNFYLREKPSDSNSMIFIGRK